MTVHPSWLEWHDANKGRRVCSSAVREDSSGVTCTTGVEASSDALGRLARAVKQSGRLWRCDVSRCRRKQRVHLPAARLLAGQGRSLRRTTVLVQTDGAALFALNFLGVTLNSGCCFALALGSWLLVKLAATNFSQYTGFFAGALETTQSYVEGFVLFNFDGWHPELPSFITGVNELVAEMCAGERRFLRVADVNS